MQIRLRRATSTEFANTNIVLALGEPAYEVDTGKLKIGDGVTFYNSLEYIGAGDLPDNVTTQGNTFNGASQLVQLDSSGKLPAIDGSQLTNLPGGNIATIFEAVDVENNDSLDTFITGGIYYFTTSTTNANKPIDDISGVLEVIPKESGDRIVQRFTRLSAAYNGCWVRTALNTTGTLVWEEWEELTLSPATTTTLGGVKPDGSTITVTDDGTLSATSSTPTNMVTTDTNQTITGTKTYSANVLYLGKNTSGAGLMNIQSYPGYNLNLSFGNVRYKLDAFNIFSNTVSINGNNIVTTADTNGVKFWKGTQTEYDGITTKDENTLYIITG